MLNQDITPEADRPSAPNPGRALPDLAMCRAKRTGFDDYYDCLMEKPASCPYALRFGSGFFCRHPDRHDFVNRTGVQERKGLLTPCYEDTHHP